MDTEYWIDRDWDPSDAEILVSFVAFNHQLNKPMYFSAVYRLLIPALLHINQQTMFLKCSNYPTAHNCMQQRKSVHVRLPKEC